MPASGRVVRFLRASSELLLALTALGMGCRRDDRAWRASLESAGAVELVGLWSARVTLDRERGDTLPARRIDGELAFTLNERGSSPKGLGERPMLFGTYDIVFETLGFREGSLAELPAVIGVVKGDSVILVLAADSDGPVELRGALQGDSIVGRWRASRLRAFDYSGDFVLRRR